MTSLITPVTWEGREGGQGRHGKQKWMAAQDSISKIRLEFPGWCPRVLIFLNRPLADCGTLDLANDSGDFSRGV